MSKFLHSNFFKPFQLTSKVKLNHRLVLPPLTRLRGTEDYIPSDLNYEYYDHRSREPGSLIITEGTLVHPTGVPHVPGIWNERQVKGWKKITDRVHANQSYVAIQLWNLARSADLDVLTQEGKKYKAASAIYPDEKTEKKAKEVGNPLTAFTVQEIEDYIDYYGKLAKNSLDAGFDIIEVHGANGYIFDQFFNEGSNQRTDAYGGSIENRARFFLQVIDEIIRVLGGNAERLAFRLSPWGTFGSMDGPNARVHPIANYGYIFSELQQRAYKHGPFAYASVVEEANKNDTRYDSVRGKYPNDWISSIWRGNLLRTGGYGDDLDTLVHDVDANNRTLIGIGRQSTSNPDLFSRLKRGHDLNPYDPSTFYTFDNWGYNSYSRFGEGKDGIKIPKEEAKKQKAQPLA